MVKKKEVSNPGSALGEAIGVLIENTLNRILKPVAEKSDCLYITSGISKGKGKPKTKLLLRDSNGIEYDIDAVIANKRFQPLILIESKYIRYKKHNRDKGSWVCAAHQSLRKRFSSVRSSVAVLAGSWSKTSKAMITNANVILFEIPFENICKVLSAYNIDFDWAEKDREKAFQAWNKFVSLKEKQKAEIGRKLLGFVSEDLGKTISRILDDTVPRSIQGVQIQIMTNLGETKIFEFGNIEKALRFLHDFNEEKILSTEDSPVLFDNEDIWTIKA